MWNGVERGKEGRRETKCEIISQAWSRVVAEEKERGGQTQDHFGSRIDST